MRISTYERDRRLLERIVCIKRRLKRERIESSRLLSTIEYVSDKWFEWVLIATIIFTAYILAYMLGLVIPSIIKGGF